jgi:hypothetical protein
LAVTDGGVGDDLLNMVALATSVAESAVSASQTRAGLRSDAAGAAVGAAVASLGVALPVADAGVGVDLARVGTRPSDSANAAARVIAVPRYAAVDSAVGVDVTRFPRVRGISSATNSVGNGTAVIGFTPHASASSVVTTVGASTYVIPAWCRYLDVALLPGGGGGGGGGGNPLYPGEGGDAGAFVTRRLERGVDIPWTTMTLTVTVGDGGAAGAGGPIGGTGVNGTATTLSGTGMSTLTAPGGRGGIGSAAFISYDQTGDGVVPVTFNGIVYSGGGPVTTGSGGVGNVPGGGGRGGNGGFFVGAAGGNGAIGQAWLRAYQ